MIRDSSTVEGAVHSMHLVQERVSSGVCPGLKPMIDDRADASIILVLSTTGFVGFGVVCPRSTRGLA